MNNTTDYMENTVVKDENQQCLVKLEVKQEIDDSPDFVDTNVCSEDQNEQKPRKPFIFYHCVTCSNKYRKADYLHIHQAVHDLERFCSICSTTFTDKRKFISHMNQHIKTKMKEDKEIECICCYCQKKFATRRRLQLHVRTHTGERPYKCEICGEYFKLLGALKDHQVTHTKKKEYVCELCKGEYTTSSSLNRHMKRSHKTKKTFECAQCSTNFSNMRSLNCHQKKVHPIKQRTNSGGVDFKRECHNCDALFDNRDKFEEHKKTQCHKKIEYECLLCGDVLLNLYVYSEHKREHMQYSKEEYEDKIMQKYPCKFCPKTFTSIQNVFRHLHVHMEKTDQCHLCYDYYSKYGLKKHMIRCHKALQCKVCLKFELGKHKLYRHYRKYHAKVVKKFDCRICNGKYMTKKALYIHHRIVHDKNKYIQCNLCQDTFFSMTDIAKHMTTNHMVKNKYSCPLCNISFKNRKEIIKHNSCHSQINRQIEGSSNKVHHVKKTEVEKNFWTLRKNTPVKCPRCIKTLKTLDSYNLHNTSCRNKVKIERKKLKCKVCYRILCNTLSYKNHIMKCHSNILLQCNYCDMDFKKCLDLKKHRRTYHQNGRIHWCYLCNRDFKKINELARHMMTHIIMRKK